MRPEVKQRQPRPNGPDLTWSGSDSDDCVYVVHFGSVADYFRFGSVADYFRFDPKTQRFEENGEGWILVLDATGPGPEVIYHVCARVIGVVGTEAEARALSEAFLVMQSLMDS